MAKILIVDDRSLNRQFLTTLLSYQKHELREASDGAEGLQVAREMRPDVIISDVLMPTMDGYEFVQRLREEPEIGKTPVIFSTAHYLSRESQALAMKCGVTSVIYKPCEPQAVLDVVAAALSGGAPPEAPSPPIAEELEREHLRLITNKLAEKTDELRDAHGKLTALIELSTRLAGERDPAELLDRYCSVAREVIGARWTLVVLLERSRKNVQHLGTVGLELEDTPLLRTALLETGIFKTVVSEGRTICLSDENSTPGALHLPRVLPRAMSLLVAPLTLRGQSLGWICLADKLGLDAFSEQDEQLAMAMAAKMAVAYDNACLYSDSTRYASKLEAEISERMKAERELNESRARLAGIIDSAMDAIITIDSDQRVVMFNEAAEKMFRCTVSDAVGQPFDIFMPQKFRSAHSSHIEAFGKTGVTTRGMASARTVYGLRADGEEFPLEASISQIEVEGQKLFTVIMRDITDRVRAWERFTQVIERAPNGMVMVDHQGCMTLVNSQMEQLFGYSRDELLGKPVEMLVPFRFHGHHSAERDEFMRRPAARPMGAGRDLFGRHKDGSEIPVEIGLNPIETDRGMMVLGTVVDITERKLAEESVRRSQAQLSGVIGSAMDAIVTIDADQRITLFNAAAEKMFRCPAEDALGQEISRFMPERFRPDHANHIRGFGETGVTTRAMAGARTVYGLRSDGEEFPLEASISQIEVGGQKLYTVIMRDITERKRDEQRIQHLNRVYAVLSDINQMIARTREPQEIFAQACRIAVEKGKFLMAWIGRFDKENQRIEPIAWAGAEEGYLQAIDLNLRDEGKAKGPTAVAIREGHHVVCNDLRTDPSMEPWRADALKRGYRSAAAFPLKLEGASVGNFNLYAAETGVFDDDELALLDELALDISFALEVDQRERERQEAETSLRLKSEELAATTQQLWQASKLATMGELAASIAHELNNPLATVGLRAESLLMQMRDQPEKQKSLEIIAQEVDRMAALVNNLLQFSRRGHRQISTADVGDEIATSVDFVHYHLRSHGIEVKCEFDDGLPSIHADRQQLRQLFLNLLTNASDAMRQGGTLTVRAARANLEGAAAVAVEFADTGEGISAENLVKIWEPFFTTKPEGKGTGLGLAICRRIIEEHGGTIEIESRNRLGTTVRMLFPATADTLRTRE